MEMKTFFDNFELLADAPNGVQKLREMILQLAVQGKLVPQDPNDEPASVLLGKVKYERFQLANKKKIKLTAELPPFEDGIAYKVPDSWKWESLGNISYQITDGTHFTPKYIDSGVPFLSVKNISRGLIGDGHNKIKYLTWWRRF